ncbi:hypothetical protein BDK51DRAFT_36860 [Blyttiomyces helicus]|uniref:Uncharacterized protein n=1 Tax=Blyttiomyces helicus TaxID=388810 RepID=A0A4P9WLI5_9FUNG|nr:hypothetical protein BDK51DRAFT_36860 [Blyttiomyces helicus]|eukprot:RKO92943.1 hypothetical protein BDK51DRAFT_36860 [Blyttiomyces helicus]
MTDGPPIKDLSRQSAALRDLKIPDGGRRRLFPTSISGSRRLLFPKSTIPISLVGEREAGIREDASGRWPGGDGWCSTRWERAWLCLTAIRPDMLDTAACLPPCCIPPFTAVCLLLDQACAELAWRRCDLSNRVGIFRIATADVGTGRVSFVEFANPLPMPISSVSGQSPVSPSPILPNLTLISRQIISCVVGPPPPIARSPTSLRLSVSHSLLSLNYVAAEDIDGAKEAEPVRKAYACLARWRTSTCSAAAPSYRQITVDRARRKGWRFRRISSRGGWFSGQARARTRSTLGAARYATCFPAKQFIPSAPNSASPSHSACQTFQHAKFILRAEVSTSPPHWACHTFQYARSIRHAGIFGPCIRRFFRLYTTPASPSHSQLFLPNLQCVRSSRRGRLSDLRGHPLLRYSVAYFAVSALARWEETPADVPRQRTRVSLLELWRSPSALGEPRPSDLRGACSSEPQHSGSEAARQPRGAETKFGG